MRKSRNRVWSNAVPQDDQRSRVISLTDAGRKAYEELRPTMDQASEYLLRALTDEERATHTRLNRKILMNLRVHPI